MHRLYRPSLTFAFALLLGLTLTAQAKPNFSGVYTMVPEKSDFGPMLVPKSMTRTITHAEPAFKVVTVQTGGSMGDTTVEVNYSTDGKPQQNTVNGAPMTTVGKWDGTAIVLNSTLMQQGTEAKIEDRYSLSDAGKTLTVVRKFETADGGFTATIVLAKK
jgi:hypothetical protein